MCICVFTRYSLSLSICAMVLQNFRKFPAKLKIQKKINKNDPIVFMISFQRTPRTFLSSQWLIPYKIALLYCHWSFPIPFKILRVLENTRLILSIGCFYLQSKISLYWFAKKELAFVSYNIVSWICANVSNILIFCFESISYF